MATDQGDPRYAGPTAVLAGLTFEVAGRMSATANQRRLARSLDELDRRQKVWTRLGLPSLFRAGQTFTERMLSAPAAFSSPELARALQAETRAAVAAALDQAKSDINRAVKDRRVPQFIDKRGRSLQVDSYVRTVLRTKAVEAYNLGTVARGQDLGIETFTVIDGTGDPLCAMANGARWSAEQCIKEPIAHPNCSRRFVP